jgi:hypothetical protein
MSRATMRCARRALALWADMHKLATTPRSSFVGVDIGADLAGSDSPVEK